MTISDQVKSLRKKLGISQTELGEVTGMGQTGISRIECGSDVKISTLERVAKFLQCDVVVLFRDKK